MDIASSRSNLQRVLPLFLVLLLGLAIRIPSLHVPLERDEGGFAYIADHWQHGAVPYRDAFDNKPPMLYFAYRVAIVFFGATPEGIHLFFILIGLLEIAFVYKMARRWIDEPGALAAALAFSLLAAEPTYATGTAAQAEGFMLLPLLLGIYWLPSAAFLSGLCLGAACMIKQTAALYAAAFGLWLLWNPPRRASRGLALARYAAGVYVVPALFGFYFWMSGAWPDFWYAVVAYNRQHTTNVLASGRFWEGLQELSGNVCALAPAEGGLWLAALAGFAFICISPNKSRRLLVVWGLAAGASLCVGFRFANHYFVELAPVVALLAGCLFDVIPERLCRGRHTSGVRPSSGGSMDSPPGAAGNDVRGRGLTYAGVLSLILLPYLFANHQFLFGGSPETFMRAAYEGNYFVEAVPVARYIQETTVPSDSVLIFGSEPEILFAAQRPSATRHIFFYPLTLERATPAAQAEASRLQREAAQEIERHFPRIIVWVNNPLSFLAGIGTDPYILNKGLEWIRTRYVFEGAVMAGPGQPSRYYLGPEAVRKFDPAELKQAAYVLYRLKEPNEN